ncbi:MAG: hypothetical protein WA805_23240 [Trebonia sp.]|uniref:hypothetical protein n=1 Tax=Trebonia sp. TaxID=2767075 RepID=UPI003C939B68
MAGGQAADWLIEQSNALADAHHEMSDVDREAIKTVLTRCKAVNVQRNHLAHSVAIGLRFNPAFQMVRSRRHKYSSDVRPFTLTDIRAVASELLSAGIALTDVMTEAVGRDLMDISEALFWEDSFGDDEDS